MDNSSSIKAKANIYIPATEAATSDIHRKDKIFKTKQLTNKVFALTEEKSTTTRDPLRSLNKTNVDIRLTRDTAHDLYRTKDSINIVMIIVISKEEIIMA